MSPLLKSRYPEACGSFQVFAKEWSVSLQRQRSFCSRTLGGLGDKTVLVLGCGFGDDAVAWFPHRPGRVIGVDIVNYQRCWDEAIAKFSNGCTSITFLQRDLVGEDWSFIGQEGVDVIFSYAVLEHISDLSQMARRAFDALKPGGLFVATYGPLWYGPNGDHTFPLAEDDYYNHLMLDDTEYDRYIDRTMSEWKHHEHGCEGPFLLERGYFSFLRPEEYLRIFVEAGYEICNSHLNISTAAERYFDKHPERLPYLKERYGLNTLDLYANGSVIILRKS
ncbi:SAM-dependent methyltransferase [Citrifermentans bemidjiense Bem]|uniref:SAM-dependent methyltransferase n=1 Tax=Citrifermentans bemidjiense (strain ATCC BAA-1014 / DSM 16622 / JCM 12645 / Bem) TaxID=404380 RepID=B5E8P7_CITBB|nr:class I SAM-dependent methyltransferase [Citrifermentans bemidjiense]ACH38632.1 SAM-dependent methyltransferase [Citrifermentans bemidjiense Bem]